MLSAITAREALAAAIGSVLPPKALVYAAPPAQLVGTSLVIAPRAPYRVHDTFSGDRLNLSVAVYITHNVSGNYLDTVDRLIETILPAIDTSDFVLESIVEVGSLDEGYVVAVLDVYTIL